MLSSICELARISPVARVLVPTTFELVVPDTARKTLVIFFSPLSLISTVGSDISTKLSVSVSYVCTSSGFSAFDAALIRVSTSEDINLQLA